MNIYFNTISVLLGRNAGSNCWGEMTGPTESMMGINTKPKISLNQKLKLLGQDFNFVFKHIDFFCSIRCVTISTYKQITSIIN